MRLSVGVEWKAIYPFLGDNQSALEFAASTAFAASVFAAYHFIESRTLLFVPGRYLVTVEAKKHN